MHSAALKGYAQMLTRRAALGHGQELADWQSEAVEAIDIATSRIVELTDDLLDVTRPTTHRASDDQPSEQRHQIEHRWGTIEITACEKPTSQQALLSMRDHGIVTSREQQSRIFGRFERADNAREREIKGTGLYLCRELVEEKGTTFSIALPDI